MIESRGMVTNYICVDVETTGLNPKSEKIIEIGAVKVLDGQVAETFQSFLNPGRLLEPRIVALTGITDEMLAPAPSAAQVLPQFREFCDDLPLIGHNLSFDYSFLKRAMVNEKLTFDKKGIDTLKIARKYLPELESRNLGFLCRHFEITHTAHRALGDAEATARLYEILGTMFYERAVAEESTVFVPKLLLHNVKKDQPITVAQKEQITRYCAKLHITLEQDLNSMTRAEASRFIERYHAAFKGLGSCWGIAGRVKESWKKREVYEEKNISNCIGGGNGICYRCSSIFIQKP